MDILDTSQDAPPNLSNRVDAYKFESKLLNSDIGYAQLQTNRSELQKSIEHKLTCPTCRFREAACDLHFFGKCSLDGQKREEIKTSRSVFTTKERIAQEQKKRALQARILKKKAKSCSNLQIILEKNKTLAKKIKNEQINIELPSYENEKKNTPQKEKMNPSKESKLNPNDENRLNTHNSQLDMSVVKCVICFDNPPNSVLMNCGHGG